MFKDLNLNISKGRIAFNIPLKRVFSAIGFHSTYGKYDVRSDLYFGIIYSFKYNFNKDFTLSLGSNFSMYQNKIKGTVWFFDDFFSQHKEKVDTKINLFNIDLGFWLKYRNVQFGFTNKHINKPSKEWILHEDTTNYQLTSKINVVITYDLKIGQMYMLKNGLLIYDLKDFSKNKYFIFNNLFEINNKYIIGLSTKIYNFSGSEIYSGSEILLSPNFGFNLSDKFNFIMSFELLKINSSNGKTIEGNLTINI